MQLRVEKSDGSSEVYLHTKVMGTIARALAECDGFEQGQPEQLAEAVTTYLRRRHQGGSVASDEIHSMIEVVLCDTGSEIAALVMHEHRVNRQIRRHRIEVVHNDSQSKKDPPDGPTAVIGAGSVGLWNKTVIVEDLKEKNGLSHNLARAVAGAVEEKMLRLGSRRVTSSLVGELVANELWDMLQAEKSLTQPETQETEALISKEVEELETAIEYETVAAESG